MKLKNYLFILLIFLFSVGVSAQETVGPTNSGMLQGPIYVPSIAQQLLDGTFKYADDDPSQMGHPKRKQGPAWTRRLF